MQFDFRIYSYFLHCCVNYITGFGEQRLSVSPRSQQNSRNWSWRLVQRCRWCTAWEVKADFIDPVMSFSILLSSHWADHSISAAIIYVLQSHTSLSGVTPASQGKMLMAFLHFTEPHLFPGICILILLWLVEVLGFFCGHMFIFTQSI